MSREREVQEMELPWRHLSEGGSLAGFAAKHGIPRSTLDYRCLRELSPSDYQRNFHLWNFHLWNFHLWNFHLWNFHYWKS